MARFDKFNAEHNSTPSSPPPMPARALTNGRAVKRKSSEPFQEASPPTSGARNGDDEEAMSDVVDSVPKSQTKKRKTMPLDDARYAAKLQAEEYSRLRSTRGGASKKTGPVRKKMRKRVSSQKVKVDGDSDVESGTGAEEKRKVNRSGGFHVCALSASAKNTADCLTETIDPVNSLVRIPRRGYGKQLDCSEILEPLLT